MNNAERELVAFVVEAKKHTYAAENPNETVLPDGGRKLVYCDGLYIYEDVYYGFHEHEFYGRERRLLGRARSPVNGLCNTQV